MSFTVCSCIIKSGASDPLTTKKQEGGIVPASTIFSAQSVWCLWLGKQHHFWWWTVGEVNWLCRQAGRPNKQSTYLDVCEPTGCANKVLYLGVPNYSMIQVEASSIDARASGSK